ncbi:MAG: YggS family pyridoxal phosphate-dependent enzyme, partial [Flavobacteriaceae bacterium]|nr:YggS family pyridoxal phosphate-dependent enzyme [Flavobacteriaceae bacterium]
RNKVKYMAEYVSLIHGVDSLKLLKEINKQAKRSQRTINCLLQIKIAEEDSKFGLSAEDAKAILNSDSYKSFENIQICGLMGMATFTEDQAQIKREFQYLKTIFEEFKTLELPNYDIKILSMGMSGDYELAIDCGSTMVRIGSSIFGARNYD